MDNAPKMSLRPTVFHDEAGLHVPVSSLNQQPKPSENLPLINDFLGKRARSNCTVSFPVYYGGLLAWSILRYIEKEGWSIIRTLNHQHDEPKYESIELDYQKEETLPTDAKLLIKRGKLRLMVAVEIVLGLHSSFYVESAAKYASSAQVFAEGVKKYSDEHNFYRAKKIEFVALPRFLDFRETSWTSIVLDSVTKREIKANTIDFFTRKDIWQKYGIPIKRGILLSGEPGTGKTLICKALMTEAKGITCIASRTSDLELGEYISDMYSMAADLRPSIIFIEDLDIIGKKRDEFSFRESALVSLLNAMDGIQEKEEIVTVATTNYIDVLDKALKERPSRFDRVIKLNSPALEQRNALINLLSRQIPLDGDIAKYIARKTEGFTPAQIKEVMYSLIIEYPDSLSETNRSFISFPAEAVDSVIHQINGKFRPQMGFASMGIISDNGNK